MTQPADQGKTTGSYHAAESEPVVAVIRKAVGDQHFQHWFRERSRFSVTGDTLHIYVPNPFISNWLLKRFRSQFSMAAAALLGPAGRFELSVDESLQTAVVSTDKVSVVEERAVAMPPVQDQPVVAGAVRSAAKVAASVTGVQSLAVRPANRRRFRQFAGLMSGECNDLALMAAQQVAEFPGERFNPLYIHGPTGVGKTHLLEAIYSEVKTTHTSLNVMYLTSESFTNYFTQALASRTVPSFRQRFRNVDVLLVDNIEFLDNKRATQEEFLHTVVQVVEHGGQLVITGDRHPRLLSKHREELTTRFMSGLVCRIESPSEETRRRIAASLALPIRESFTQEALDYVAIKCRNNVREIQGALNCLHGHYKLGGKRITVSRAREILGDMERECRRLVRISDVEKVICDAFGLTTADLRSKSRRKAVSCPRAVAMYIARKLTKSAYREIGMYFGGRDHSTVVAAEKRVQLWIDSDSPISLPTSCRGRTVADVIHEIEERLLSLAL
ncbi:MAG: chromosomal replication initiator protein DnaA [Fuerstiella sp.]|jgi:chromosomal replication initiator protein|nr:chromosomal replication initiator protein DnaA [Fuerstiella sp.]